MRSYAFVLASMYMYSWLITFEIFQIFFLDRGVGGWGVSYPKFFFDFYISFIFTRPLSYCVVIVTYCSIAYITIECVIM